jgi:hypothetical protein
VACPLRYPAHVRLPVDPAFLGEANRFALRFTCDACLHFLPATGTCAHFWPNAEHKTLSPAATVVVFCKEFELL